MNKALVIAASIGVVLATTACSGMKWPTGDGSDGGSYMGGSAPVGEDPAGSATFGTGSTGASGEDRRNVNASGQGLDG